MREILSMGWMYDRMIEAGGTVIADFICPPENGRSFRSALRH
jgi:hypothetical protein